MFLLAWPGLGSAVGDPVKIKVTARLERTLYQPNKQYEKTLVVEAKDATGAPVADLDMKAKVQKGPVKLFKDGAASQTSTEVTDKTGPDGIVKFGLDTEKESDEIVEAMLAISVESTDANRTGSDLALGNLGAGFQDSFRSDRVSSEVFIGTTIARSYDKDGKSTGFDETSTVGRFRADTNWRMPVRCWRESTHPECRKVTKQRKDGTTETSYWRDNWGVHTGIEVQFSSFPQGPTDDESTEGSSDNFSDFADAYTGSLVVTYQPISWSSYSDTSHNEDPEKHYDAFRHGITARVSVTSREGKENGDPMGDTDIRHFRVGYLFSHHQTAASSAATDKVNVFPMRFVEVSYAKYEEIFGKRNQDRVIVEAGLRLPGLGNDAVPFYAGLYLNGGKGQDDFRVFAGLLFRLDRIAKAFNR
jgi:hypothetical protein